MATLLFDDGRKATADDIALLARTHRIVVEHQPIPAGLESLLHQPLLDRHAEEQLLSAVPPRPEFPARDLIVLHPDRPDNEELATKFESWHRHGGDEIRHILDGAGVFGVIVDGQRAALHVGPGDFIVVPAGLEHNFRLTSTRRIKALRYLSDAAGWAAEFTGRAA
ncbi:cupin domain-containing protein [Rhodopseudomonas sp. HC1]|uniref:cupin domain-containing protein n=1 Tax=Rhodopseudomonas infernalis TaxID=2897386 RepID=UPI001EE99782|nr:cupin domain-containing protein [Rhodopseudomonas infernalis]MCG6203439.1 cupin domain-containing protein [Rhodopseudomonas infernalis]